MISGKNEDELLEIEVKIRIDEPERLLSRLESLGAACFRDRHLEDNLLYDYPDLMLAKRGCLLRLRRRPGEAVLTFKGKARVERGAKVRLEREVKIGDPDTLAAILEGVGFKRAYRYQKYRTEFEFRGLKIAVDELPIGNFIELEGDQERIGEVGQLLGFQPGNFLTVSYRDLHREHAERIGEAMGDLLFPPSKR